MSRLFALAALPLFAASVLAAPASVFAAPAAAQAPPVYQYRTLPLKNISPAAVLAALHWNASDAVLPQGVRRIFGLQSSHSLLVEGTPDGYERVKTLVAPLDAPAPKPAQK